MAGAGTNVLDGWEASVGRADVEAPRVVSAAGEEGSTDASRACESRAWLKVCSPIRVRRRASDLYAIPTYRVFKPAHVACVRSVCTRFLWNGIASG